MDMNPQAITFRRWPQKTIFLPEADISLTGRAVSSGRNRFVSLPRPQIAACSA